MIPHQLVEINGLKEYDIEYGYVYFLMDVEEVVYVGKTMGLSSRIAAHKRDKVFDRCFWIPVPEKDLLATEGKWINKFSPKYNRTHGLKDVKKDSLPLKRHKLPPKAYLSLSPLHNPKKTGRLAKKRDNILGRMGVLPNRGKVHYEKLPRYGRDDAP